MHGQIVAGPKTRYSGRVIIKLNNEEMEALSKDEGGSFGGKGIGSFMEEMRVRMKDNGEIDIDRDDIERIQGYQQNKAHRARIEKVFRRPLDEALKDFFG